MVVGLRSLGLWAGKITAWFRSKDERNRRRQYELAPSALKNALYSYLCAMVSALCANNTCPLSPRGRFNARVGYSCCWRRRPAPGACWQTASRKRGAGLLEATEQRRHFSLRALLWPSRANRGAILIPPQPGYRYLAVGQDGQSFLNKALLLAGFPIDVILTKPNTRGNSFPISSVGDGETPNRAQHPPHGHFAQISCGIG